MLSSRGALLWLPLLSGSWPVIANPAMQTRVFLNSTLVSKVTDIYTPPPLVDESHTISTVYWISYTRPRSTPAHPTDDGDSEPFTTILPNDSSSISSPTKWENTTAPYPTRTQYPIDVTSTKYDFSTSWSLKIPGFNTSSTTSTDCVTLAPGEPATSWSIVANTTVITVTLTNNETASLTKTPEFTPPQFCSDTSAPVILTPKLTSTSPKDSTDSAIVSSTSTFGWGAPPPITVSAPQSTRLTVTVITTSKNAVTVTTQATIPTFPGGGKTDKQTVNPSTYTDTHKWTPFPDPPPQTNPPLQFTTIINPDLRATTRITQVVDGITLVVSPSQAVIGGQIVDIGNPPKTITEGGDVFTVSPSQVVGPFIVIMVPTSTGSKGMFQETPKPPKPTTVQGVPVQVGPTAVVIGDTTIPISPGASTRTFITKGQTIVVGPGGVGFSGTTITPPPNYPTNVVVVGGEGFSAIGSSIAVIGGRTISYGPGISPQTVVFNGEVITVGPQGIVFDGTTLGGAAHATGTQYGIAGGLSVTEIGSTLAVINGMTLTVGPGASPFTTVIGGQTVIAGPSGLVMGGNTLTFPFNPSTQAITAGGITFTQVGPSLAVIGGKTYTFGPGAPQTTTVIDGQTVSIGPGGIGFATTTLTAMTSTPTGSSSAAQSTSTKKKNGAGRLGPVYGVLGACMAFCIGCCCFVSI